MKLGNFVMYIGDKKIENVHIEELDILQEDLQGNERSFKPTNDSTCQEFSFQIETTNLIINKLFGNKRERYERSFIRRCVRCKQSRKRKQSFKLIKKYYDIRLMRKL